MMRTVLGVGVVTSGTGNDVLTVRLHDFEIDGLGTIVGIAPVIRFVSGDSGETFRKNYTAVK